MEDEKCQSVETVDGGLKTGINDLSASRMVENMLVGVKTVDLPENTIQNQPQSTETTKIEAIPMSNDIIPPIVDKMAKFNSLIGFILDREGRVYENVVNDPGGGTKYGISSKSYPNLDIKNLTEDKAKEIYYNDYWLPLNCDNYETKLALCIFDCGVNQGLGKARQILSEFINISLTWEIYLLKRLRHYFNLCVAKPTLKVFLIDWTLRLVKCAEFKI